jgi:hypothetical protein
MSTIPLSKTGQFLVINDKTVKIVENSKYLKIPKNGLVF